MTKRILTADDSTSIRAMVRFSLEIEGCGTVSLFGAAALLSMTSTSLPSPLRAGPC
jgi:DNA-binding NtrC family response regulator